MTHASTVDHEFVDHMPSQLVAATIYISIRFRITAHMCLCGCGEKVVNPLRPHQWALTYDGATISLTPSIGNSGLPCSSHYWITRSQVRWLPAMTDDESAYALRRDGWTDAPPAAPTTTSSRQPSPRQWRTLLRRLLPRRPRRGDR